LDFFWIFDLFQLNLDWQKNSKTTVEKGSSLLSCHTMRK
jgi:hypothetical protein